MKLLELFSGIGAQYRALSAIAPNVEVVGVAEIEPNAIKAYGALHKGCNDKNTLEQINRKIKNLGDITQLTTVPYADMWTISFPCTDISTIGYGAGLAEGSETRSSLLWESLRLLSNSIAKNKAPKFLVFENVKALINSKHKADFDKLIDRLSEYGYNSYYKVLNATEFNVPQNRERVFVVCIRKDIDKGFVFPEKRVLQLKLDDLLEKGNIPEGCYISEGGYNPQFSEDMNYIENISDTHAYTKKIVKNTYAKLGYLPTKFNAYNTTEITNVAPTQTTAAACATASSSVIIKEDNYRLRRLTAKEVLRLMGFNGFDYIALQQMGLTDNVIYKLAGNSIVVPCLEALFNCLIEQYCEELK